MTVVSLYDIIEERGTAEPPDPAASGENLAGFAARMAKEACDEYARLRQYEEDFGDIPKEIEDDDAACLKLLQAIWGAFRRWAKEAEEVLDRIKRLESMGHRVAGSEQLRDCLGRASARLTVTPEEIIESHQQVRRGEVIPAQVLRDELRARLQQKRSAGLEQSRSADSGSGTG
jgi:hypothetical protein